MGAATTLVVLGNRLVGAHEHPELSARLDAAAARFAELGGAEVVLSGGRANPDVPASEAAVMRAGLLRRGVPAGRMLLEEDSLDTVGNAYFTARLLRARGLPPRVEVVTSCYHVARSLLLFRAFLGPGASVEAPRCAPFAPEGAAEGEGPRLDAARRLLDGVPPGDLGALGARLRDRHALYRDLPPSPEAL